MGATVETIKIAGLRELQAAFKEMDGETQKQLRVVLNKASDLVVGGAGRKVPTRSGKARGSIRAASSQREARIKAGGSKAAYYPWLDFGGSVGRSRSVHRTFKPEGRYLWATYSAERTHILGILEAELVSLAQHAGLVVH